MVCGECGQPLHDGAKFCPECGTPVARPCAACGSPLVAGAKFCSECGAPVGGEGGGPRPDAAAGPAGGGAAGPVAERRMVSILFADLVGFTTIAEGRDAESVRELLSDYFDLCREITARYGGTIEKFIGDAVMAVWGAPIARENDAERAVRAALDLVAAVRTLGAEIQARGAVLTGDTAVTLGATNQGMVAGDLVNTASRLQGAAAPGTVLVGEATMRAAESAIAFEPAGDLDLKGKALPVTAYRAVRVIAERGGRGRSDRLEAPFVGRDVEFNLLRELVHATSREGRPRLVSVTGLAGVGKSRMTWELSKYLDGVVETVYWHSGRSPAYGSGVTFWALGEMVRSRAGLAETDDDATTRSRIAETVAQWVTDPAERRWIEGALLALLGVDTAVTIGRDELFSAWRTFFERIAERGTVLLVFEDLHWADGGLLDFIDHLLDWSKASPIMIVTLARPDLLEWRPGWGAGRRNFVGIALEPLPTEAMRELLAGLVPGLPDAAAARIVARADGIPLYAVETVRMLVANGRLVEVGGRYEPDGDLADLAIPETLQALVAARLDALPATERSLVHDAAVLGQSFTPAGLAAVSGLPADEVTQHLGSLVRREILVHDADPRSPERGQYAFVQALLREVAYGTLARRDRRIRHLAAARFFESLGEDELAGALASHYVAAYRASADDPEAPALAAQARLALRGAADRATALGSLDQAAAYFLEAVEVTTDDLAVAELYERAGVACDGAGRSELAEENLRAAIDRYRAAGDRIAEARATGLLGRALANGWRGADAVRALEPALERFADLDDDRSLATIEHELARAHWFVDGHAEAIGRVDQALVRAERIGDVPLIADALITRGSLVADMGRPYEGLGVIRAGLDLAEAHGLHATVVRGLNNLGATMMDRDPREALDLARRTIAYARRFGLRSTLVLGLGNASELAFRIGGWAEAEADSMADYDAAGLADRRALMRGLIEIRSARGEPVDDILGDQASAVGGDSQDEGNYYGALAAARFVSGDDAGAAAGWLRAGDLNPINEMLDLPRAARAMLLTGDVPAARDVLRRIDARGGLGPAALITRTALAATLAGIDGRRDEAIEAFARVAADLADFGLLLDEAMLAIDMTLALGPDEPAVGNAIERARIILDDLGAVALRARLDGVVARGASGAPVPAPDRGVVTG